MASSGLKLKTTDIPNCGKGEVEGNSNISILLPICTAIYTAKASPILRF